MDAIVKYIARDNAAATIAVGDAIEQQMKWLRDFPAMGRRGRVRGTRELVITGLPYIAVYRALVEVVEVVRVLHGAQQWPPTERER